MYMDVYNACLVPTLTYYIIINFIIELVTHI